MAYEYPYDRQSSRMSFTVTVTSYIWVTQILKTMCGNNIPLRWTYQLPFFFAAPSPYFQVTLLYIRVTQNTTSATSNPSNDIRLMESTIQTT